MLRFLCGKYTLFVSIAAYKQTAIALKGDYLCPEINIELSGTTDEVVEVWESLWLAFDWGSTKNSLVWAARVFSAIELLPTEPVMSPFGRTARTTAFVLVSPFSLVTVTLPVVVMLSSALTVDLASQAYLSPFISTDMLETYEFSVSGLMEAVTVTGVLAGRLGSAKVDFTAEIKELKILP